MNDTNTPNKFKEMLLREPAYKVSSLIRKEDKGVIEDRELKKKFYRVSQYTSKEDLNELLELNEKLYEYKRIKFKTYNRNEKLIKAYLLDFETIDTSKFIADMRRFYQTSYLSTMFKVGLLCVGFYFVILYVTGGFIGAAIFIAFLTILLIYLFSLSNDNIDDIGEALENGDYDLTYEIVVNVKKESTGGESPSTYYVVKTKDHPDEWTGHFHYSLDIGDGVWFLRVGGYLCGTLINEDKYRYRYSEEYRDTLDEFFKPKSINGNTDTKEDYTIY